MDTRFDVPATHVVKIQAGQQWEHQKMFSSHSDDLRKCRLKINANFWGVGLVTFLEDCYALSTVYRTHWSTHFLVPDYMESLMVQVCKDLAILSCQFKV